MSKAASGSSDLDFLPDLDDDQLKPENWLEDSNWDIIRAVVENLGTRDEVQAFVAYENRNNGRKRILNALQQRAKELKEEQ